MAIYLTDEEVRSLITTAECVDVMEDLFRQEADGLVENVPRRRNRFENGALLVMGGIVEGFDAAGIRLYGGARGNITVFYNTKTGSLDAMMETGSLSWIRTGAASGLATKYLALPDADVVGIIGTGRQAVTQLEAVCAVRPVKQIRAFSRNEENRRKFAAEMQERLRVEVVPVSTAEEAVRGCPIVITITNSRSPVFDGNAIEPGTHINAAGANSANRLEVDATTVRRAGLIVVDNLEQAKMECGELIAANDQGIFRWAEALELHDMVAGRARRTSNDAITLFESQGIGIEDVAACAFVLKRAREREIGQKLPF